MFCTKCGNSMEDGARFCTKCGQSFAEKPVEDQLIYVSPPETKKKSNKTVIVLLSVLIAVIVVAAIAISTLIISDRKTSAPDPAPITSELRDNAAVKEVVEGYLEDLPRAVNSGDYSYIEPYILYGSPLYDMQTSLVDYNYAKGVTEKYMGYELEEIRWVDDYTCYVTTDERYEISSGGRTVINDYEWKYTVVWEDGQYYLINLEADD